MSKTIIELAKKSELTKALYDFRSKDGLTFADYQALLKLSRPNTSGNAESRFTICAIPIEPFQLWEKFLQARRDLCVLLSSSQFQLQLEDVVLLQALSATNSFVRNLGPVSSTNEKNCRAFKSDFDIGSELQELSVALYMPAESKFIDFFAKQVNYKSAGDEAVNLNDLVEFMKQNPRLGKKLYGYLEKGFRTNYIPEVDIRFYNKWATQGVKDNNAAYVRRMRQFGISDEIMNCYSTPQSTYFSLCHNVKNGLCPGETILHILNRDLMQKRS